jgi:hypothetical protein
VSCRGARLALRVGLTDSLTLSVQSTSAAVIVSPSAESTVQGSSQEQQSNSESNSISSTPKSGIENLKLTVLRLNVPEGEKLKVGRALSAIVRMMMWCHSGANNQLGMGSESTRRHC